MSTYPSSRSVVSTVIQFVEQTWTSAVRAALIQSDLPSVPTPFQEVIRSGHVLKRMKVGTSPFRTNASHTTLRVPLPGPAWPASLCRGVPLTDFFPPPFSRREHAPPSRAATQAADGEAVCRVASNAILDKTSDAHSQRH